MKQFTTAVEEILTEEEREAKIKALIAAGKSEREAEVEVGDADTYTEFMLDDRLIKAYTPTPAQLAFLLASMGRGQTKDRKFAGVMNVIMQSLDEDDQEHLENRLLSRKRGERLELEDLEKIFEYLVEEWFATPTQGS